MATAFLPTANTFLSSPLSSSASPSSSLLTSPSLFFPHKHNAKRQFGICKAVNDSTPLSPNLTKRSLSICFITSFGFLFSGKDWSGANAAILEAEDDEELLEKVKRDRKKRIERQGVISSSNKERYLQDLVYKLSKVGQAIDNNDLSIASSVLGGSANTEWVKNANIAFTKGTLDYNVGYSIAKMCLAFQHSFFLAVIQLLGMMSSPPNLLLSRRQAHFRHGQP